jgi:hypothetical protein
MRARRRRDRLWLWLWNRDKFWHHVLKMRSTDNLAIMLYTMRLTTEALSGLLRTASHLASLNTSILGSEASIF